MFSRTQPMIWYAPVSDTSRRQSSGGVLCEGCANGLGTWRRGNPPCVPRQQTLGRTERKYRTKDCWDFLETSPTKAGQNRTTRNTHAAFGQRISMNVYREKEMVAGACTRGTC